MNYSEVLDPDQELFRSLLLNDLHDISLILPNIKSNSKIKCDHCGELFNDIYDKKNHEKTHYSFKCNKCFVVFTSKVSLGAHVLRNHNENATQKPKNTKQKPLTPKHIKREVEVKAEIMEEITRKDPNIRSRLEEMLIKRDGLWVCAKNCGRSFKDKGHALDHVETYVDYLVYPCKTVGCTRTFNTWTKLRSHNKINGGCRAAALPTRETD